MGYLFDEDEGVFRYLLRPNSKINKMLCELILGKDGFSVLSYFNINIEENRIESLTELLNKINKYTKFTSFVFNADKKEVYCQCYTNCCGVIPSKEIINSSLFGGIELVARCGDYLADVAAGKEIEQNELQKLLDKGLDC